MVKTQLIYFKATRDNNIMISLCEVTSGHIRLGTKFNIFKQYLIFDSSLEGEAKPKVKLDGRPWSGFPPWIRHYVRYQSDRQLPPKNASLNTSHPL